jgi:hypothetical protein
MPRIRFGTVVELAESGIKFPQPRPIAPESGIRLPEPIPQGRRLPEPQPAWRIR